MKKVNGICLNTDYNSYEQIKRDRELNKKIQDLTYRMIILENKLNDNQH